MLQLLSTLFAGLCLVVGLQGAIYSASLVRGNGYSELSIDEDYPQLSCEEEDDCPKVAEPHGARTDYPQRIISHSSSSTDSYSGYPGHHPKEESFGYPKVDFTRNIGESDPEHTISNRQHTVLHRARNDYPDTFIPHSARNNNPDPFIPHSARNDYPDTFIPHSARNDYPDPFIPHSARNYYPDTFIPHSAINNNPDPFIPHSARNDYPEPSKPHSVGNDYPDTFIPHSARNDYPDTFIPHSARNDYPNTFIPHSARNDYPDTFIPHSARNDYPDTFIPHSARNDYPELSIPHRSKYNDSGSHEDDQPGRRIPHRGIAANTPFRHEDNTKLRPNTKDTLVNTSLPSGSVSPRILQETMRDGDGSSLGRRGAAGGGHPLDLVVDAGLRHLRGEHHGFREYEYAPSHPMTSKTTGHDESKTFPDIPCDHIIPAEFARRLGEPVPQRRYNCPDGSSGTPSGDFTPFHPTTRPPQFYSHRHNLDEDDQDTRGSLPRDHHPPSQHPSKYPSQYPSEFPLHHFSESPFHHSSESPFQQPSASTFHHPSGQPSKSPSRHPTQHPGTLVPDTEKTPLYSEESFTESSDTTMAKTTTSSIIHFPTPHSRGNQHQPTAEEGPDNSARPSLGSFPMGDHSHMATSEEGSTDYVTTSYQWDFSTERRVNGGGSSIAFPSGVRPVLTLTREQESKRALLPREGECGVALDERIIGGQTATLGQFPWIARLAYTRPESQRLLYRCAGSLISPRYVLTAAHCVTNLPGPMTLAGVRLGEVDERTDPDCDLLECADPAQDFLPELVTVHPGYNQPKYRHDLALIRLDRPANITSYVSPICLPDEPKDYTGHKVTVAGWGTTSLGSGGSSPALRWVRLEVVPALECAKLFQTRANVSLGEGQLCAAGKKGQDSCSGDSGGPLMRPEQAPGPAMPRHVLLGLVSFGPTKCGNADVPGVHTVVSTYMGWLLDNIQP